ncbi:hypothetical protein U1Q18_013720 [Sarracenia purpurea var. burkii]
MEENAAALHTAMNSVQALGKGFDLNFDTRLLYCKGVGGSRVVEIDEEHTRDLCLYDTFVVPNVSRDIVSNSPETAGRNSSGVCSFLEESWGFMSSLSCFLGSFVCNLSRHSSCIYFGF